MNHRATELPFYSPLQLSLVSSHREKESSVPMQHRGQFESSFVDHVSPWLHQRVTSKNCAVPKCDSRHGSSCWMGTLGICPPRFHLMDLLSFMHGGRHTVGQVLCSKMLKLHIFCSGSGFSEVFSLKETRFNLNVWRSQEQHDASRVVRQGKDASLMGSSFKNCEVPAARELCRLLHHTAWSLLRFRHV